MLGVLFVLFFVNIGQDSPLEGLAFTLLVGTLCGSYSTIFIACPYAVWVTERKREAATEERTRGPRPPRLRPPSESAMMGSSGGWGPLQNLVIALVLIALALLVAGVFVLHQFGPDLGLTPLPDVESKAPEPDDPMVQVTVGGDPKIDEINEEARQAMSLERIREPSNSSPESSRRPSARRSTSSAGSSTSSARARRSRASRATTSATGGSRRRSSRRTRRSCAPRTFRRARRS